MVFRVRFAAVCVLSAFCAAAFLYYRQWVNPRPNGVILFVAPGLDAALLAAARLEAGGPEHRLALDRMPHSGLMRVASADNAVPDTAAAATSLSTGHKVLNGYAGMDTAGSALDNLLYIAQRRLRATGFLTTAALPNPVAAAFTAHVPDPAMSLDITAQMIDSANADILMGGGLPHFLPAGSDGAGFRDDGRNLVAEARAKGVLIVESAADLDSLEWWRLPRVLGLFSDGDFMYQHDLERWFGGKTHPTLQPRLPDMVATSIPLLQRRFRNGYFLVVHAGLIAKAAGEGNLPCALGEMRELDHAVRTAMAYAGRGALVVVAAPHGVAGFELTGSVPLPLPAPLPSPFGPPAPAPSPTLAPRPAPSRASVCGAPSASDALVFGAGPGSERLDGIIENTDLFEILRDAL